jgi:hypothetical protein
MARRKPQEKTYVRNLSINPNQVAYYLSSVDGFKGSSAHSNNQWHLDDNDTAGKVSYKARKNIELALSWLLYGAKNKKVYDAEKEKFFWFKVNFVTLTLSAEQMHSDEEITRVCLGNFLDNMRKRFALVNYLWRAEAQANGNIHFHITTDVYLPHDKLRMYWNRSQQLLGYVSAFSKKHGHANPNSTDVHSVKHVKRLAGYLSKYMCKNRSFACIGELRLIDGAPVEVLYGSKQYKSEENGKRVGKVIGHVLGGLIRPIESRLWFCSRSLSSKKAIKVSEDMFCFDDVASIIKRCEFKHYNYEFTTVLYGSFDKVIDYCEQNKNALAPLVLS